MKFIYAYIFFLILPPIGFFFWFSLYSIFKNRNESETDHQALRWLRNCLLWALVAALWVVLAPDSCMSSDDGRYDGFRR